MLALILGLCLSLIGTTGTVHFDGDIDEGLFDYVIVRIYSCDSRPVELIWTSGRLFGGDHYDYLAYFNLDDAQDNTPFKVSCISYTTKADGLEEELATLPGHTADWSQSFSVIPSGSSNYYFTCDF